MRLSRGVVQAVKGGLIFCSLAHAPLVPQRNISRVRVAIDLLARQNLRLVSCRSLQSLWAGYGHICHILAAPMADGAVSSHVSLILKYITPPHVNRGSKPDEGHTRKLLSYQIELSFYTHLAPDLPPDIAVAACRASLSSGRNADLKTAMLLTDLRPAFPVAGGKRAALAEAQVYGALRWLAGFHGHWWPRVGTLDRGGLVRPPLEHFARHGGGQSARVWLNGGYTYLQTRRGEYADLCEDGGTEWSEALCRPVGGREESLAELVARVLAPCAEDGVSPYETLIHGDVKSENLFTSEEGDKVAFFDFQYVGLGLGVCDLAKLFTCSVPRSMLGLSRAQQQPMDGREEKLLRFYLERLRQVSGKEYEWDALVRHWEAALVDWLRFQASWGFWGNTEWLEGRVRSIIDDRDWLEWLLSQTK
ncbi:hypothetical protein M406DRAFT_62190 [Cryphonectria parasitica EP155]|uniref:Aminoglycoside phosphotransferase domain-containing protein n=1 Tax=Cryphonectria parasitica (strain ATCC 38755 / EP155) TaxID=660469 RepID=A0A9P4Y1I0_CRYP1|nr:uncharacterized protein M406DRAFT_62190 [Cryphonectria parasitica EP155]KAF3764710.1 hypothetical protein M406DRAFT_62190 [Cryphonectria parasitica EP155]